MPQTRPDNEFADHLARQNRQLTGRLEGQDAATQSAVDRIFGAAKQRQSGQIDPDDFVRELRTALHSLQPPNSQKERKINE